MPERVRFLALYIFIILSIHSFGSVYGIQKITFPVIDKELINEKEINLFFNVNQKNDTFEIYLDYDSYYDEDNGIININLIKQQLNFGFIEDNQPYFYKNNKKTALSYNNSNIKITTGWDRGIRNSEYILLISGIKTIFLTKKSIVDESESIYINNRLLKRNTDYTIDNTTGIISLQQYYPKNSDLHINYSYYSKPNAEKDSQKIHPDIDWNNRNITISTREDLYSIDYTTSDITIKSMNIQDKDLTYITLRKKIAGLNITGNIIDTTKAQKHTKYIGYIPEITIQNKKIQFQKYKQTKQLKYRFSDYSHIDIYKKDNNKTTNTIKINQRFNNIFCDSHITMDDYKTRNQDILLSYRKKNYFLSITETMQNGQYTQRQKRLIYFRNKYNISITNRDSEIYKGISTNYKKLYINTEWKDISNINTSISLNIRELTISYLKELTKTYRVTYKNQRLYTSFNINDKELNTNLTNLTIKNTKITYDYKKSTHKKYKIKFYTIEDFLELEYSPTTKTGTFSYNIIIN